MKKYSGLIIPALTALTLAACDNNPQPNAEAQNAQGVDAVQIAIPEGGFTVKQADMDLIAAVKSGNARRVKALLDNNDADPNAIDETGTTSLMYAAGSNNNDILDAILEKVKTNDSTVLDRGNPDGKSPMIFAAEAGFADAIISLRKKGANPNVYDATKNFPLLIAARNKNKDVVEALLKNISGTVPANPNLQNQDGDTALLAATVSADNELIKMIKDYGGNINIGNQGGITPLTYSISKNDTVMFDYLLTLGADINDVSTNKTPLIYALETKNYTFAQHILDKGADVNKYPTDLTSPLQVLVSQENADVEMAKRLIAAGAKTSKEGEPASLMLSRAIRKGNAPIVQLLIDNGLKVSDLETPTKNGLIDALNAEEPEIAVLMINNGTNVSKTDEQGFSPLAIAAKKNYPEVFKALVKAGADVNQTSRNKSAVPVEIVLDDNNAELLRIMFENGLKASSDAILLRAVSNKNAAIVPVALANGAKPNIMNTAGQPALWLAVARDENESAKALVDAGAILNVQDDEKQLSPLSLAIARANVELADYFLDKGANPNLADRNGYTSLTYAVAAGQSELVKKLITKGAEVRALDKRGNNLQQILTESKINPQKKLEIKDILTASGLK